MSLARRFSLVGSVGDMMDRCADAMSSMMGGGMMRSGLLLVILIVLLALWLVGLTAVGVLGLWVVRRLSSHTPSHNFGQCS